MDAKQKKSRNMRDNKTDKEKEEERRVASKKFEKFIDKLFEFYRVFTSIALLNIRLIVLSRKKGSIFIDNLFLSALLVGSASSTNFT